MACTPSHTHTVTVYTRNNILHVHEQLNHHEPRTIRKMIHICQQQQTAGCMTLAKESLFSSGLQTGQDALLVSTTLYMHWAGPVNLQKWFDVVLSLAFIMSRQPLPKLYTQNRSLQMVRYPGISHSQGSSFPLHTHPPLPTICYDCAPLSPLT